MEEESVAEASVEEASDPFADPFDNLDEVSEEVEEAPEQAAPEEPKREAKPEPKEEDTAKEEREPKEAPKKFKVVLEGEELEVTEDELIKGYQRGTVSAKKFEEAAKMRKQLEQVVQGIVDPRKLPIIVKHLGGDPAAIFEAWRQDLEAWAGMSEQERAQYELMTERQKLEQQKAAWEAQRTEAQRREQHAQAERYLATEIKSSIEALQLPPTPQVFGLIADTMVRAQDAGVYLTPGQAAEEVANQLQDLARAAFKGANSESVKRYLGEEFLANVGRERVEKVRSARQPTKKGSPKRKQQNVSYAPDSMDDFSAWLDANS